MLERIKRLYNEGRINLNGLLAAVSKKLITEDQFFSISGRMYDEVTGNKAGEGKNSLKEVTDNAE